MSVNFSKICSAPEPDWAILQQHIDFCARRERSYEYAECSMPPGCHPSSALVGFSRQRDGSYLLYWRPAVDYHGPSRVLFSLFQRNIWRFPSFTAMSDRLRSLVWEMNRIAVEDVPPPCRTESAAPLREAVQSCDVWPPLYLRLADALQQVVLGQEQAVAATAFRLYSHLEKREPARPLSLVFYGPTGVGKSELGKALVPALEHCCNKHYQFIWTDLNTFTQPHSVHRLTGAPPGYVGYEDQAIFEAVREAPYTVFMFDELEKAHPEVLKVFMSILDEGRCTAHRPDATGGRELDFRKCVFIFTTNADLTSSGMRPMGFSCHQETAGSQYKTAATPAELSEQLFLSNESARRAMIRHGVLAEIAGRFSGFIGFQALNESASFAVIAKQIMALGREYGLQITRVDPSTIQAVSSMCKNALSARSAVSVLEGILTPAFSQAARLPAIHHFLRLSGIPGSLKLAPDQPTSSAIPVSTSNL